MLSRLNADAWLDDDDWYLSATGAAATSVAAAPSFRAHLALDDVTFPTTSAAATPPFAAFRSHQDLNDVAFPANSPATSANADLSDVTFPATVAARHHDALTLHLPPTVDNETYFAPKANIPSIFGSDFSLPFGGPGYELLAGSGVVAEGMIGFSGIGGPNSSSGGARLFPLPENCSNWGAATVPFSTVSNFSCFDNSQFLNRGKLLQPLESSPPLGAQPNLFQKRALRQNSGLNGEKGDIFGFWNGEQGSRDGKRRMGSEEDGLDEGSFDGSAMNYDSDEDNLRDVEESGKNGGGGNSNVNGSIIGAGEQQKGKKKGLPAKNLMAERRRRKKLNDRLYMLRSVVPKISKMDRASILGDAVEYLKELLQRINDLHNELESAPTSSALAGASSSSFHPPLTPTSLGLPGRIKEELCPSSLPSPSNQPARVEVGVREGQAVNIHMFCARKPGLLLSTMRALDGLGLDIQQAVISCFNGFALDVFRAEQCKDGPGAIPEEIKTVLLHTAGFH